GRPTIVAVTGLGRRGVGDAAVDAGVVEVELGVGVLGDEPVGGGEEDVLARAVDAAQSHGALEEGGGSVAAIGDQGDVASVVLIDVLGVDRVAGEVGADRDVVKGVGSEGDRALEEDVGAVVGHGGVGALRRRLAYAPIYVRGRNDGGVAGAGVAVVVEAALADREALERAALGVIAEDLGGAVGAGEVGGEGGVTGEDEEAAVGGKVGVVSATGDAAPQA